LDRLLSALPDGTCFGQRPGDFTLAQTLEEGTAAWPTGRCFNEALEIRWWPTDEGDARQVLIVGGIPTGWEMPSSWDEWVEQVAKTETRRYLCIGKCEPDSRDGAGRPVWWQARYGRALRYLETVPPKTAGGSPPDAGRVYLITETYWLEAGRTQHRLIRFEHATPDRKTDAGQEVNAEHDAGEETEVVDESL